MRQMSEYRGRGIPLRASDVDTDQIIPSEWLKRVERTGFGQGLFADWRDNPEFVLNDMRFSGGSILIALENFGVGSSREHAVWALTDWGFRVVISPRFGDIFRNNATKTGLLPVVLERSAVDRLLAAVEEDPGTEILVDVVHGTVSVPRLDLVFRFDLSEGVRNRFVQGLDDIDLTLARMDAITAFEERRPSWMPRAAV